MNKARTICATDQAGQSVAIIPDCPCDNRLRVRVERRLDPQTVDGKEEVSICLDCGRVHVKGHREYRPFYFTLYFTRAEQVAAAGIPLRQP